MEYLGKSFAILLCMVNIRPRSCIIHLHNMLLREEGGRFWRSSVLRTTEIYFDLTKVFEAQWKYLKEIID